MEWFVRLKGIDVETERLLESLNSPVFCLTRKEDGFFLKSNEFGSLDKKEDVLEKAKEIVSWLNGTAAVTGRQTNLEVDESYLQLDKDGKRQHFVRKVLEVPVPSIRVSVTVDGVPVELQNPITTWIESAQKDDNVAKVLRLFGKVLNWVNLYRIYEVIESDVGGIHNIVKGNWATNNEIKRFKHTANNPGVAGDDARHGKQTTQPPPKPMSLSEAKSLVKSIFQKWIEEKT
jgi:hypothetical protein